MLPKRIADCSVAVSNLSPATAAILIQENFNYAADSVNGVATWFGRRDRSISEWDVVKADFVYLPVRDVT